MDAARPRLVGRDRCCGPDPESVVVERGDTLWDLADEHLDDPYRWPEIYEENRGDPQPGGGALTDPDLIQPGWELDLPGGEPTGGAPPEEAAEIAPRPAINGSDASALEPQGDVPTQADTERAPPSEDRQVPQEGDPIEQSAESVVPTPTTSAVEPIETTEPAATEPTDDVALLPIAAAGTLAAGLVLTLIASVGHASAADSPTTASRFRPARRRLRRRASGRRPTRTRIGCSTSPFASCRPLRRSPPGAAGRSREPRPGRRRRAPRRAIRCRARRLGLP